MSICAACKRVSNLAAAALSEARFSSPSFSRLGIPTYDGGEAGDARSRTLVKLNELDQYDNACADRLDLVLDSDPRHDAARNLASVGPGFNSDAEDTAGDDFERTDR